MIALTVLVLTALAAATATIAFSVAAKLADWEATTGVWPVRGRLRHLLGPAVVTALEIAVLAAAAIPWSVRLRLAVLCVLYLGYAITAAALRGRDCGCFGGLLPSRFTDVHVAACAAAALALLPGVAHAPVTEHFGAPWVSLVAGGAAVLGLVGATWLHRRRSTLSTNSLPDSALIERVVIYTSATCTFCAALLQQQSHYRAMAGCPVEFRHAETELDQQRAGNAYPAAVPFDAGGEPVYEPVHGMTRIRDLLRYTTGGRQSRVFS